MRRYTNREVLINNVPYLLMLALGAIILALGLQTPTWTWVTAVAYIVYGVAGAVWIMAFVCPYCGYYNTRSCPCGYGLVAARFRRKAAIECFSTQFKKHIPVIVPLWFIPVVVGGIVLAYRFTWWYLGLLVIFAVNSFVILPLFSKKHSCVECPQKDTCLWMGKKT